MTPLVAAALALLAAPTDAPALLFPAETDIARLRLDVAPSAAWGDFLGHLFGHFDRDGDGFLSPAEAARVFPLPLPGGRQRLDFAALDANRDGRCDRAEFRRAYRAAGFGPVAVVLRPAPPEAMELSAALFRHLDRDGDGALSGAELRDAPKLLRRLDEDEDEALSAAELLAAARPDPILPRGLALGPAGGRAPAGAALRLSGGGAPTLAGAGPFRLAPGGSQLSVPGGTCGIAIPAGEVPGGVRAARGFYLAQFRAAAGDKPAPRALFADDPAAQALVGLFDAADRDGDGALTLAELGAFFDLIEAGAACRTVVAVSDRGRNLFDLLDADGDGRLDPAELAGAARRLPHAPARPADIPASYRLTAGRGPLGDSFGPVPFGAAPRPRLAAAAPPAGPRWFRAMDRNGDGFVSAAEFLGPPALFAELDRDGDGRISPAEAMVLAGPRHGP